MRVLHVIDKISMDGTNPSSCTVLFGGWNPHMQKLGCEISVLSLAQDQSVGAYLRDRGIPDYYSQHAKLSPKIITEICDCVASCGAELIHLHGYGAAHFGRLAARRIDVPNVVHEHAVLKIKPHHFVVDWLLRGMTDAAVAVSENVREFMIKGRSVPPGRIRVIGNGIDLSRFKEKSAADVQNARNIVGISNDAPVIGIVTRFREEKGTGDLIAAFRQIRKAVPDARLVVIGDGPLREALREAAEELNISDATTWLGFRQDVEQIMPAFDVQVIPSISEGFGLALIEGMATGNAMVATEVGGMKELGRSGHNVAFVPPRDPSAIAAACVRVIKDPDYARTLVLGGLQTAGSLGIDRSADAMVQLYQQLLAAGKQ